MPPFALKIDASFSTETKSKSSIMASVEAFKSAVVRIRDILRGPGVAITGMDSMRHICLYLLSRYMTKDKVKSLGVPDEFAWENLIETAQTKNGGVQKALDCFFHKETDCLVNHFDRLFGTENFSFDIKNPAKHKEMLEILDKVNMEQIDCQMDTLGWVYEQHLKTGSSAARDLGQFFTDRFICDYMVNLCKPGFKGKGVPESVCDPSMGTGGFLTSYIKYYKKNHAKKALDWSVQNKEIHGCDTDPKVAGVARLNLFMESGGNRAVNLRTHDSLYGDLTQTGYDIILANMPFGLKGIKHAECCERVKNLKIRGTKSEPLFLQLMMVSLNRGGRCAVVVPDGMLVNSASCHDETRKYLLDHFELKRIIKMKGQFFMNTNIQPSILYFENTGKPTISVEFWDVIRGVNGEIQENVVLTVSRANFDNSCSFDICRYHQVKEVEISDIFPKVKVSDICKFSGTACKNEDVMSNDINILNNRFLYFWLLLNNINFVDLINISIPLPSIQMQQYIVTILDRIYLTNVNDIHETLNLTDKAIDNANIGIASVHNISEAKKLLLKSGISVADLKAKMTNNLNYLMVEIFNMSLKCKGSSWLDISSFCKFERSKIQASKNTPGEYPFISLSISTHNLNTLDDSEHVFISAIPAGNRKMKVQYQNGKCSHSSLMFHCLLDTKKIVPKYFYYYLHYNMNILNEYVIGVQPKFSYESFLSRKITLPTLEVQQDIIRRISILEYQLASVDALAILTNQICSASIGNGVSTLIRTCISLSSSLIDLNKQAEDNARFILDSYLNTA